MLGLLHFKDMPLKLNLLAEAQALEDLRRRDPVKRALWIGLCLLIMLLGWSSSLKLKAIIAKGELSRLEAQISSQTNSYQQVLEAQKQFKEVTARLAALDQLAANRLLHGTILNALQQTTVDDVQLIRFQTDLQYVLTEEVKAITNNTKRIPGKPATITEKIAITFEAKDTAPNPGDMINAFKTAVGKNEYFKAALGATNEVRLVSLSPPSTKDDKPFVLFTLEARYPEVTR